MQHRQHAIYWPIPKRMGSGWQREETGTKRKGSLRFVSMRLMFQSFLQNTLYKYTATRVDGEKGKM